MKKDAQHWLVDSSTGSVIPLFNGFSIGRVDGDLQLDQEQAVSSKHCVFHFSESGLAVEDVGSRNGTFVNGKKIPPKTPFVLRPGSKIDLGNCSFVVKTGAEEPKVRETAVELASLCSQLAPDSSVYRSPINWAAAAVPKARGQGGRKS